MSNTDPIVLHVPGREVPAGAPTQPHSDIAQFFKIEEKKAFTVEALLRGAPVEAVPFKVKPDDIVELEYEGDLYRWMRADQPRDDLQEGSSLRAAESSSESKLTIPPDFGAPPTRGGLDLLLKGLKVLGIDPTEGDLLAAALVGKLRSPFDPVELPIAISVSHGHMRQAEFPVMVGHTATRKPEWDKQLSTVLFQLLIPGDLRSYLQDRVNVVLVVDEVAAGYP